MIPWLRLAATPSFAVMAMVTAMGGPAVLAGVGPLGRMPVMYLLMALFHATPWLERAAIRPESGPHPSKQR